MSARVGSRPDTERRLRRVQVRTTAVAIVTVVVAVLLGSVALVQVFERQQIDQVDDRLESGARVLDSVLSDGQPSMPAGSVGDALVQLVDADGTVLFAAPSLAGQPAMRSIDDPGVPLTAPVEGLGEVRVIAIPFGESWVLYAESLQGIEDSVAALTSALWLGVPILIAVLGALVWFVVGRTLRPVREAIAREHRLVADVGHELRTPLAGARALLESESQVPEEIELNRLEALAVLHRIESMVNHLLLEERTRNADARADGQLVDLDDVVLRVVSRIPLPDGVDLDATGVSAGQVRGREEDLERMVTNLLTNATRHARGNVHVTVDESDDTVTLAVVDDGPGIAVEDRERVFDRFTRLDDARAADGAGAGLGLPIARAIAVSHGGTVEIVDGQGASFVVALPGADSIERRPGRIGLTSRRRSPPGDLT